MLTSKNLFLCLFGWAELYRLILYRFDDITTFSLLAQWRVLDCVLVNVEINFLINYKVLICCFVSVAAPGDRVSPLIMRL